VFSAAIFTQFLDNIFRLLEDPVDSGKQKWSIILFITQTSAGSFESFRRMFAVSLILFMVSLILFMVSLILFMVSLIYGIELQNAAFTPRHTAAFRDDDLSRAALPAASAGDVPGIGSLLNQDLFYPYISATFFLYASMSTPTSRPTVTLSAPIEKYCFALLTSSQ